MSVQANRFFIAVKTHADSMLAFGRDPVEEDPSPLFAGVVNPVAKKALTNYVISPPGIRVTDYNWCGNNLMHDIPFLETLSALSRLISDHRYEQAVEDVFSFYGKYCPHPETGLFPWGEHLQWSFEDRKPMPCGLTRGFKYVHDEHYLIHDHLHFAPVWFWERMWARHPAAVVRFAHGLNFHIMNPETFEHNRHAPFAGHHWNEMPYQGIGKDFARHAGFFIFDCCFAYRKSGDVSLLDWSRRKRDWHLGRRLPNGLVRACIRTKTENEEGQHDQLALALWDASLVLGQETPEGREFGDQARELFDAKARWLAESSPPSFPEPGEDLWMAGYMRKSRAGYGSGNILMYYYGGLQVVADRTVEKARWTARHLPPPPAGIPVMARVFNAAIDLQLTAFDLTGDASFLGEAARFGDLALKELFHADMLLGASHMKIFQTGQNSEYHVDPCAHPAIPGLYYSVSGTPILTRTLLRLALKLEGMEDLLGVDTYSR